MTLVLAQPAIDPIPETTWSAIATYGIGVVFAVVLLGAVLKFMHYLLTVAGPKRDEQFLAALTRLEDRQAALITGERHAFLDALTRIEMSRQADRKEVLEEIRSLECARSDRNSRGGR